MHQASVGFHCPECAKSGRQKVVRGIPQETPWATYVLIAVNVAVFLIGVLVDGPDALVDGSGRFLTDYGLIAKFQYVSGGVANGTGVGGGEWYRLITAGFLHASVVHIAMNMLALFMLGRVLEPIGRGRFLAIYFTSMLAGSLGALLLSPGTLTVGASGAIFGLMGAIFMGHRSMGVDWRNSPLLNTLILNLVITFAFAGMISVGGHIGGLVGGVVAGWLVFDVARRPNMPTWFAYVAVPAVGLACAIAAIVFASGWTG